MASQRAVQPGRLYQRGRVWWGWGYDKDGKRVSFSTRCTKLRAAEVVLARREKELAEGGGPAPAKGTQTVEQSLDWLTMHGCHDASPSTRDMYEKKAKHLTEFFAGVRVNDLTQDEVTRYIEARLKVPVEKETVRKELVTLRRALWISKDRGLFSGDPRSVIPRFRVKYQPRTRYLSEGEFKKLIDYFADTTLVTPTGKKAEYQIESRLKRLPWLALAVHTGGRAGEIERLTWEEHINLERKTIVLPGTKTQRAKRTIPMSVPLHDFLAALPAKSGTVVERWANQRRDLAVACDSVGIERVSPNDLRRTFASWLKQKGEDSYIVAQLLGHTTARMVELVYGRINEKTLRHSIAHLPDFPDDLTDRSKGVAATRTRHQRAPSGTK